MPHAFLPDPAGRPEDPPELDEGPARPELVRPELVEAVERVEGSRRHPEDPPELDEGLARPELVRPELAEAVERVEGSPRHPEPVEGPHIPPHERFDRSVEFVRHDLKTPLWGKQAQILRAIKRHKRIAVRSCNGSGKTFVAATAVIWWLMAHPNGPAMVVTTAPTQHQVRDLLWREIRSIYYRNAALIGGILTRTTLELSPKHYATGLSTDSPARFQGFHETNILFVVDEASGVREEVFDAIEGSMTSRRARLLLIGNPTSLAGTFYKAFHQRRTQYKTIHISAFDTPNLLSARSVIARSPTTWQSATETEPTRDSEDSDPALNNLARNLPLLRDRTSQYPTKVKYAGRGVAQW